MPQICALFGAKHLLVFQRTSFDVDYYQCACGASCTNATNYEYPDADFRTVEQWESDEAEAALPQGPHCHVTALTDDPHRERCVLCGDYGVIDTQGDRPRDHCTPPDTEPCPRGCGQLGAAGLSTEDGR